MNLISPFVSSVFSKNTDKTIIQRHSFKIYFILMAIFEENQKGYPFDFIQNNQNLQFLKKSKGVLLLISSKKWPFLKKLIISFPYHFIQILLILNKIKRICFLILYKVSLLRCQGRWRVWCRGDRRPRGCCSRQNWKILLLEVLLLLWTQWRRIWGWKGSAWD